MDTDARVDEIEGTPWDDVELLAMEWIEDGRDLRLGLRLPPCNAVPERETRLICRWVRELQVSLAYGPNRGGAPLTWNGSVKRSTSGEWSVAFDFASTGVLSLKCTEVEMLDRI